MMKKIVAACFAIGALATAQCANAADLSVAPLYKAPPVVAAPAYNWSGFYVGVNGGGAWLVPLDQPGPVPWWPRPLPTCRAGEG